MFILKGLAGVVFCIANPKKQVLRDACLRRAGPPAADRLGVTVFALKLDGVGRKHPARVRRSGPRAQVAANKLGRQFHEL